MTASTYSHISSFHLPYLREFHRLGWETHVACSKIPNEHPDYIDSLIDLPFEKKIFALKNFKAAKEIRDWIKKENYNLIITHTSLAAFFTRLGIKGIKRNIRVINVVHGYLFDDNTHLLKKMVFLAAERLTAPETDLILTMNEWDYNTAKKYQLGKKVRKIPGIGVDFSRFDVATEADGKKLREDLNIPKDAFVLIYPAEFSVRKSQSVLIKAMSLLPRRVVLVLPGSGMLLKECKTLSLQMKLGKRVLFPGYITNLAPWYHMADAAVTSSRIEGLPFNVMEAIYCGLPVVASAVKGNIDLVNNDNKGLLYPYGDFKACSLQIKRIMDNETMQDFRKDRDNEFARAYGIDHVLPEVLEQYVAITN